MKNFSVLILTYNEEVNILDCVNSVKNSNDIVILDSFSIDQTKAISTKLNVRFYERKFSSYSEQRNYGLHNIFYKNEYLLILDADERASKELVLELFELCKSDSIENHKVYLVRRNVFFNGKILKRNITATVWIERFVHPRSVHYYGNVHEKLKYEGKFGLLNEYIIHHQFSKGIKNWIERRKKYAQLEFASKRESIEISNTSNDKISRRVKIRNFFMNYIPFYYLLYFAFNFFVKLAFLDGIKGLKYITLETYSLYLLSKYKKNDK